MLMKEATITKEISDLAPDFPALQLVRTGRTIRFFGRLTFWVLVFSIIAMVFAPWQQTARGTGTVVAVDPQDRPQPVLSPAEGIVEWVKPDIREGSYVEKGEIVMRIEPFAAGGVNNIENQMAAIDFKIESLKVSLEVAEQAEEFQKTSGERTEESLKQDLAAVNQAWEQARNKVRAFQAELEDKRNQYQVAADLVGPGITSRQEFITKQRAAEAAQAKVLEAEAYVKEAFAKMESKEQEIEAKKQDIQIKNREANNKVNEIFQKIRTAEKEAIDLLNKREEFGRNDVPAPRSGFIQQWNGLAGSESVKKSDQLFVLVPDTDELGVEMMVTGNDMPLIHEGDRVRLQFEGWPAVQFVGWPSTAIGTFGGKVNRVFPTDDGKGNFRVLVVEDKTIRAKNGWPDDRYLRQGVRANGWVLLKQVPLGYEIWRQLNGFPPVISDDEPNKKDKGSKVKLPKA